ncbi:flagellar motor protein MotB [Thiomicrorhabdus sp. zzn3]|uniref:OmpA/MotB family protein n=1 Tax=Thiomicrorhabdus sp. zzn3 TaxID=3039775 RepID=UPI00243648BF|nr:flagellar motor protein MotB [Thiomicrorhabdus sp. zzn3]MDG6777569.1 flagellar motor protein MotB [Thiomicrorhabdus sp. zzn3]
MAKAKGGAPWLVTFADLMSLLMAVFVLLFAMSSLEIPKYRTIVESLTDALGHGMTLSNDQVAYFNALKANDQTQQDSEKTPIDQLYPLYESLIERFAQDESQSGANTVKIDYDPLKDGILVTFPEQIAFDPGKAKLKPEFVSLLYRFEGFKQPGVFVKVIGHTDCRPVIGGRFESNWELSSARAASVIEALINQGLIDPARAQAIGVADTRPVSDGDSEEALAKNRRVEIWVRSKEAESIPLAQ